MARQTDAQPAVLVEGPCNIKSSVHYGGKGAPHLLGRNLLGKRMTKGDVKPIFQENPEAPKVMGNWRSLEQVFTNLISNAVEAMEKTGGTLAIKISPCLVADRPHVEVSISDTGPGIPEEIRKRLFEPFVPNKSGGTGLGLAITKRIVIAHRGNIDVSSVPGGTIFRVTLPVTDGD